MYEPPPAAQSPNNEHQWSAYEPGSFMPPQDDFDPGPMRPPPGRQYVQYRQPPSIQHATIAGMNGLGSLSAGDIVATLMSNMTMIAAGALLGYLFTGHWKGALGGGAGVAGAAQLPFVFRPGGLMRAGLAAVGFGIAYWALRDDAPVLQQWAYANDGDDDDEDDYEPNDDEDDEDVDEARPAKPSSDEGAKPSDDPKEPEKSNPWMREVA